MGSNDRPRLYTERDMLIAKRNGAHAVLSRIPGMTDDQVRQRVDGAFPLPPITRPRVVRDDYGWQWKYDPKDGVDFWHREKPTEPFMQGCTVAITASRVRLWADLLANPTEECDDGA